MIPDSTENRKIVESTIPTPSFDVKPDLGAADRNSVISALEALNPREENPDGLSDDARQAIDAQRSVETSIDSEFAGMRMGTVQPLPTTKELDQLRVLRGLEQLQRGDLPPEQSRAITEYLSDVVSRIGGQPVRKRASTRFPHLRYRDSQQMTG